MDAFGYQNFFVATAILGVPVFLLVWLASRAKSQQIDSQHDISRLAPHPTQSHVAGSRDFPLQ